MNVDIIETGSQTLPNVSIVVPVLNEAENISPLISEIRSVLANKNFLGTFEIVYVDDGSDDSTLEELKLESKVCPELVILRHQIVSGQSAAIRTGIINARAPIIVTIDGDGQNDPADIPILLKVYLESKNRENLLIIGHRAERRDVWCKRISSRIANAIRSRLLGDATPDTGCGLKVIHRATFLAMPAFDHMHRFFPALMIGQGGRVISVLVNHRPRKRGRSNYGTFDRLFVGIFDLIGVLWLKHRALTTCYKTKKVVKKDNHSEL